MGGAVAETLGPGSEGRGFEPQLEHMCPTTEMLRLKFVLTFSFFLQIMKDEILSFQMMCYTMIFNNI